jgi:hypothetical protein
MKYRQDTTESTQHEAPAEVPEQTSGDAARRAEILRRLIKTRAMAQESRNRSAELQCALERFKYQQAKIVNG